MTEAPHGDPMGNLLPIRLCLPGLNPQECIGLYDQMNQCWIDQKTGNRVFPSQWQPIAS